MLYAPMYAPRRLSGAISARCAAIAGKSNISPKVQTTTVAMTPAGDAITASAPNPTAKSRHPTMSERVAGQ
jgi:hypothetical protein